MPLTKRKNLLSQHRICFHCLATTNHLAKDCATQVKCSECHNDKHVTALHAGPPSKPAAEEVKLKDAHQYGGEPVVISSYTEVCGNTMRGKSCAKMCLVSIHANSQPDNKIKAYMVIDDQSNFSLAKPKLFDLLSLGGKATPYKLKMCSGTSQAMGRCAQNLVIESFDGMQSNVLPILTECNAIPDSKEEIPTHAVARAHPHREAIAEKIPELDPEAEILLLEISCRGNTFLPAVATFCLRKTSKVGEQEFGLDAKDFV